MTTRVIKQTEADTCRMRITPQLREAGWEESPHLLAEQHYFTDGRVIIVKRADRFAKTIVSCIDREHADPKDLIANMRSHENEVMRLLGEIEALVSEVGQ